MKAEPKLNLAFSAVLVYADKEGREISRTALRGSAPLADPDSDPIEIKSEESADNCGNVL
jgi:hypothetical protein